MEEGPLSSPLSCFWEELLSSNLHLPKSYEQREPYSNWRRRVARPKPDTNELFLDRHGQMSMEMVVTLETMFWLEIS